MRKWRLAAAGSLALAIAAFLLVTRAATQHTVFNPPPPGSVRIHFPDGRIELYPASKLTELKWIALKADAANRPLLKQLTLFSARFAGLRKYSIPDPATLVGLESQLQACGQYTRQSFFLHERFTPHLGQLSFFFGGPENARTPAEWVEANLNCIRLNRVAIGPNSSRDMVPCAVVVAHDSIRILPESVLEPPTPVRRTQAVAEVLYRRSP